MASSQPEGAAYKRRSGTAPNLRVLPQSRLLLLSVSINPSSLVDAGEPIFPPAYLTASCAFLHTMASRNLLDSPDCYTVAWIAALPIERAAAEAMFDEEHIALNSFIRYQTDANVYIWGRVGEHNIVIASLPPGVYGTASAATTALSLLASLPSIRVGLLVGIGGGIARPDEGRDIRLGDVVVSQPSRTTGGVCQYDIIKANYSKKRERKGFFGRPLAVLLNTLASI
ncbi:hypothetical protein PENDEC_c030G04175 [Penicillium decumbens]|uniref:Nucleoside phosphorylase domain-containing protein n=1 Tax=Penicillium decumbens TaxID=69771 RepID=A0A1V6NVS1_PENDC|nr:hypothetical protein PENDEC_c030G04175 [Penicillium decumbens]